LRETLEDAFHLKLPHIEALDVVLDRFVHRSE
jgi:hypothetical protein